MNYIYLIRVMKVIVFFMVVGLMTVSASSYSQRITLKGKNISFEEIVESIRKQTGFSVFTSKNLLSEIKSIDLNANDVPLEEFLKEITTGRGIVYQLEDN